jgi:uncharacterized protein
MSRRLRTFLIVAFASSWAVGLLHWYAARAGAGMGALVVLKMLFMFGPLLGAVAARGDDAFVDLVGLRWRPTWAWLLAWLLPPVLAFLAFGVALTLPGVEPAWNLEGLFGSLASQVSPAELAEARAQLDRFPRPVLILILLLQALGAGVTINAVAAFGEEAGWRGLMHHERGADEPARFWRTAAITGVIWGLWHAPLILQGHNYPDHPGVGVVMMVVFCVLLAPLHTQVRVAGGSVVPAAILHGTINASAGFSILFLRGGNDLVVGLTGLAGFIVLAGADLVLWWWRRRQAG